MSDGFGITGHKNTYNSKVKNGKWVEDMIGMDLAKNPPNHPTLYTTETREKIIPPADMPYNAGGEHLKFETAFQIQVKNKSGLPADMLFSHLGAPGADRFMSVNNMTFTNGKGSGGIRVEKLLQEKPDAEAMAALDIKPKVEKMVNKAKKDARAEGEVNSFSTTAGAGNTRAGRAVAGGGREDDEEECPFPKWGRRPLSIN